MTSGPIPIRLVCEFLGKTDPGVRALIKEERLPVIIIPSDRKNMQRVFFEPFLAWLNERSAGTKMTAAQLEAELERCRRAIAERDHARNRRVVEREERRTA